MLGDAIPASDSNGTLNGKGHQLHRRSYEVFKGPIPDGMQVLHKCDVPACFNPEHLSAGTAKANSQDMVLKGRTRHGPKAKAQFLSKPPKRTGSDKPAKVSVYMEKSRSNTTSVRFSEAEMEALRLVADEDGRTLSNAIQMGIKMYLVSRGAIDERENMQEALLAFIEKRRAALSPRVSEATRGYRH